MLGLVAILKATMTAMIEQVIAVRKYVKEPGCIEGKECIFPNNCTDVNEVNRDVFKTGA